MIDSSPQNVVSSLKFAEMSAFQRMIYIVNDLNVVKRPLGALRFTHINAVELLAGGAIEIDCSIIISKRTSAFGCAKSF